MTKKSAQSLNENTLLEVPETERMSVESLVALVCRGL